jgi:hypothetical protein
MRISKQAIAAFSAVAAVAAALAAAAMQDVGDAARGGQATATAAAPGVATATATFASSESAAGTAGRPQRPLTLAAVAGGDLGVPLVAGDLVYIPVGRSLTVWDYSRPEAPRQVATSDPAPGVIQSVARHGNYVYASWREGSCRRGGVVVYAANTPRRLRKAGMVADYAGDATRTCAAGIAIAHDRLYLFDTENDLYVASLANPRRPALRATGLGPGAGTRVAAAGNLLWAAGRSFLGGMLFRSVDISVPDAPREAAFYSSFGTAIVNAGFQAPYVYGFGHDLSVLDMSDPSQISVVGSTEMPYGAWTGVRLGDHVFSGGFHGLDVWSVAVPSAPTFVANHDVRTFAAREALDLGGGYGLMLGSDDRLLALDARNPAKPGLASERVQAGGINAMDVAHVDGYAVLLQYDYGLTVADPQTLAPLARLEPALPDDPEARGYSAMAVQDHIAYLAAWGYGLIVVDLSEPLEPREIARLAYPFASSVEVVGNRLYLGKNTNGPTLGVIDVTEPARPQLLSNWSVPDAAWDMAAEGSVLFAAERGTHELGGGVRVLDMSDAGNVVQLARWEGDCESATGASLDATRDRLYVACRSGLRILDVSDPATPRLIGGDDDTGELPSTFTAVAAHGDRAWYASGEGIAEYDVSVPGLPRLLRRTPLAGYEPIQLRTAPDGSLLATTWSAGVHLLTK